MIRRRRKNKQKRTSQAVAKGDEPPDPITLTVLAVTGTVLAATGTAFGAVAAKKSADQQSALARANAAASQRDAAFAKQQSQYNESLARQQAAQVRGSQIATIGASGLDFTGTPLDLLQNTTVQSEINAQQIQRSGQYQASSYSFQAAGDQYQAGAYKQQGNYSLANGLLDTGSTLLSGGVSAKTNFSKMKAGTF